MKKENPEVTCTPNGPYQLRQCDVRNSEEKLLSTGKDVFLCRCGGSSNKPFCDGTHMKNGFSDKRITNGEKDIRINYKGQSITIHDNRGICAHAGFCTGGLASVFKLNEEPWIDPDGAKAEDIIKTIGKCPSGALSYTVDEVEHRNREASPMATVTKNGPYAFKGHVKITNEEQGEGASPEHFTLCRCGGSSNKPFCDGTHWHIGFEDEKN